MNVLRQSTGIVVRVGPFIDPTDGVTPVTNITLSGADQAELLKAGGGATVDISGATWTAVTGANGWYDLTLTTAHTDTTGELVIVVQDASASLPIFHRFQVVTATIYDQLWGSSAALNNFDASTETVTVGTNNDKSGYSISGTKTTLDALNDIAATDIVSAGAITTSGGAVASVNDVTNAVTAGTVIDKSGYSLGIDGVSAASMSTQACDKILDTSYYGITQTHTSSNDTVADAVITRSP